MHTNVGPTHLALLGIKPNCQGNWLDLKGLSLKSRAWALYQAQLSWIFAWRQGHELEIKPNWQQYLLDVKDLSLKSSLIVIFCLTSSTWAWPQGQLLKLWLMSSKIKWFASFSNAVSFQFASLLYENEKANLQQSHLFDKDTKKWWKKIMKFDLTRKK